MSAAAAAFIGQLHVWAPTCHGSPERVGPRIRMAADCVVGGFVGFVGVVEGELTVELWEQFVVVDQCEGGCPRDPGGGEEAHG